LKRFKLFDVAAGDAMALQLTRQICCASPSNKVRDTISQICQESPSPYPYRFARLREGKQLFISPEGTFIHGSGVDWKSKVFVEVISREQGSTIRLTCSTGTVLAAGTAAACCAILFGLLAWNLRAAELAVLVLLVSVGTLGTLAGLFAAAVLLWLDVRLLNNIESIFKKEISLAAG
jgi:hypothetical protein